MDVFTWTWSKESREERFFFWKFERLILYRIELVQLANTLEQRRREEMIKEDNEKAEQLKREELAKAQQERSKIHQKKQILSNKFEKQKEDFEIYGTIGTQRQIGNSRESMLLYH